jgi:tight adherence protein B
VWTLLLIVLFAAVAGAGILLAFTVLAFAPAPDEPKGAAGLRGQFEGAFEAVAQRVTQGQKRRGRPGLPERLARAGLRIKPSEYVMVQGGCATVFGLLALVRFGPSLVVPIAAVIGMVLPGFYLKVRIGRRLKKLNEQLVDVLSLMANSLKAGHSLPQTIDLISKNARAPISEEFARSVRELQVGGSMEKALNNLARRSGSDDVELVVTAMLVQLQVGGNLANTLETIAHTIRERVRIKGEISAATAQGKMSGWIVTGLPIAVATLLFVMTPTYFRPMTQQLLGWAMLVFAGFLILVGNLIIRKIVKIQV